MAPASTPTESSDNASPVLVALALRGGLGGLLMGLANLVPGISGGTMLLAAGVYPRFIAAIGEVTTFKFRRASLVVFGSVVVAALAAIVLLAGPVKTLVVDQRWVMYSLFIGLTLGGVPVLWRLIGRHSPAMWVGAVAGFGGMAVLAYTQASSGGGAADHHGFGFMLLAGVAGASAMILPGVSGGYLLLVLGVYVPILAGISTFKDALKAGDTAALGSVGTGVILPVGLGVLLGVVLISNLLKWLLDTYPRPTLGVLLGLLLGAVVGLYPFVSGIAPEAGDTLKGQTLVMAQAEDLDTLIYQDTGKPVKPEDWPLQTFSPTPGHLGGAVGLVLVGLATTLLIDRIGTSDKGTAS